MTLIPTKAKKQYLFRPPVIEDGNAIKAELASFVHSIIKDEPTVVSEIDGYLAMEVAHQILEKINKSTSVLRQAPVEDPKPPKEDGSEYALDFEEED